MFLSLAADVVELHGAEHIAVYEEDDDQGQEVPNDGLPADFLRREALGTDDGVMVVERAVEQGIGRELVAQVCRRCPGGALRVGTGETPGTLQFYRACGFVFSHRVPDFFTRNYDHPIVEEGVLLRDMIYLQKQLPCGAKQERRSRGYGK